MFTIAPSTPALKELFSKLAEAGVETRCKPFRPGPNQEAHADVVGHRWRVWVPNSSAIAVANSGAAWSPDPKREPKPKGGDGGKKAEATDSKSQPGRGGSAPSSRP